MVIDFSSISELEAYKIMSNSITPRPIAWIATQMGGIVNLAPFSYFAPLSSKPPVVVVSIGHKENGLPKDTLTNLTGGSKATINFVDISFIDEMSQTAQELPKNQSETTTFNIRTKKILEGYPPIVEGVSGALFCTYIKTIPIDGSETTPVLLQIQSAYFQEDIIDNKKHIKLENVGRVGMKFLVNGELI